MTSDEAQIQIIQMVTGAEEAIGRLYETYANRLPEHEEFWFGLVVQEGDHSNLIYNLIKEVENGSASFAADVKLVEEVKNLQELLKREQARAKREKMSFADALQVALDIDKSLVKHGFYRLLRNPSGDVSEAIEKLRRTTANHIKYLQKELEKHREQK